MKEIFYLLVISTCLTYMTVNARDEEEDKNISHIPRTFTINQGSSPLNKKRNEIESFFDIDDFNEKSDGTKLLLMIASGILIIEDDYKTPMGSRISAAEDLLDKKDLSVKQKVAEILFTIASDSTVSTWDRTKAAGCLFNQKDPSIKQKGAQAYLSIASNPMIYTHLRIITSEYLFDCNDPSIKQKAVEILFTIASDSVVDVLNRINASERLFNPLAFNDLTEEQRQTLITCMIDNLQICEMNVGNSFIQRISWYLGEDHDLTQRFLQIIINRKKS